MKFQHKTLLISVTVVLLLSMLASPIDHFKQTRAAPNRELLSPYWSHKIQRWDTLIVQAAERHALAPDLLASLVQRESDGVVDIISSAGAVGLTQVMSSDAGFSWRPTQAELLDPETNLFWGAQTLNTIIHQGKGNLFNALAAYNGGWEKIAVRGPRVFAAAIMRNYAAAVVQRLALPGRWIAYFGIQQGTARGPIWIADAERSDVYFYGRTNRLPNGSWLIPHREPTTIVARCVDKETGAIYNVALWVYAVEESRWLGEQDLHIPAPAATLPLAPTVTPTATIEAPVMPVATLTKVPTLEAPVELTATPEPTATPTTTPLPTGTARPTATPSPTTTPTDGARPTRAPSVGALVLNDDTELRPGPTLWWNVSDTLAAGTELLVLGYDPAVSDWIYVSTLAGRDGWVLCEMLNVLVDVDDVPLTTPPPTPAPSPTPTLTPTPKPKIACNGEPLFAEAWAIDKFYLQDIGWAAVVFARGYEGTCRYTYAWNSPDNIVGGPTYEPVLFEVSAPRLDSPQIVGSVIISDGVASVTIGVFITPP